MDLRKYKSLLFDCDGVVLNSNELKSRAFYDSAISYGKENACKLLEFHKLNGGVSRYKKFKYFFNSIVKKKFNHKELESLIRIYSDKVKKELQSCQIAPGLFDLRNNVNSSNWFIVSGGDQTELRRLFEERSLNKIFNGGIYGSPDTKEEIVLREMESGNIKFPAIFFGDSKYDYEVAKKYDMDFVFIFGWSELENWREYCKEHSLTYVKGIRELI